MPMNVHQLELFYHVVLHAGVSDAAKALDKEQPTLSKQINELEGYLGAKLYHRRPFRLTEKGEWLFAAIEPFFRELPKIEQKVKGRHTIRIGASPVVLMEHLPAVEKRVRKRFPNLHLILRESNQPQLLQWLGRGEIDLAITLLPREVPQKTFTRPLLQLKLVLLVPKKSPVISAAELWRSQEVGEPLISLMPDEIVCREFQHRLEQMEIDWLPEIEVGSLSLVEHYVEEGYGIGLSVRMPGRHLPPTIRAVELPDFPAVPLGMMWRDETDKLLRAFRDEVEARAAEISAR